MKGVAIAIEGIDGAGKGTAHKILTEDLRNLGFDVVASREPGGTPLAEKIRELLIWSQDEDEQMHLDTELLLVYASRAQHYRMLIDPALADNKIVLLDRFFSSSRALQSGGGGIPLTRWHIINDYVMQGYKPDLTILFDLPVSVGTSRAKARGKLDRFEKKGPEFHERVRAEFLTMAAEDPKSFRMIDAHQSEECVREQVRALIPEIIRLHMAD